MDSRRFFKKTFGSGLGRTSIVTTVLGLSVIITNKSADLAKTGENISETKRERIEIIESGITEVIGYLVSAAGGLGFAFKGLEEGYDLDGDGEIDISIQEGKKLITMYGSFENVQKAFQNQTLEIAGLRAEAAKQSGVAQEAKRQVEKLETQVTKAANIQVELGQEREAKNAALADRERMASELRLAHKAVEEVKGRVGTPPPPAPPSDEEDPELAEMIEAGRVV